MRSIDFVAFPLYFFIKGLPLNHGSVDDENWTTG
jgi:hypothetical protein